MRSIDLLVIYLHVVLARFVAWVTQTAAAQRSDEWYNARRSKVGASEVATLIGRGYGCTRELISGKVFDPRAPHMRLRTESVIVPKFLSLACSWGVIFEDVLRDFCERRYQTVIHEIGSVEGRPGQACSVDGLGVVTLEQDREPTAKIALFEYKCPLSRNFVDGVVPAMYLPQVLTGLETIPCAEIGVFMEASIRRAALEVPGHSTKYDSGLQFNRKLGGGSHIPNKSYMWGAIMFTTSGRATNEDAPGVDALTRVLQARPINHGVPFPIDLGQCSRDLFTDVVNAMTEGLANCCTLYQQFDEDGDDEATATDILQMAAVEYKKIQEECPDAQIMGVMRWKMLQVNIVAVDKVDGYVDELYPLIQIVNDTVRACDLMDDNYARMKAVKLAAEKIDQEAKKFPY